MVSEGRDENIHQKTWNRDGLKVELKEIFVDSTFIANNRENWTHLAKTYAENTFCCIIKGRKVKRQSPGATDLESTKKEIARGCIITCMLNSVIAGDRFISLICIEKSRCVREIEKLRNGQD